MSEAPLPDPLEKFLRAPPVEPLRGELRDKMLAQTAALLPRRRVGRRWPIVSAVAASVAPAFVAGYLLGRGAATERQAAVVSAPNAAVEITPQEPRRVDVEEKKTPVAPVTAPTAFELEWQAFDAADDAERARLYFRAGDLYLAEHQDVSGAARCYRQALSYSAAQQGEFDPRDNWLVLALKHDHHREK
jgi:hypothetical protein